MPNAESEQTKGKNRGATRWQMRPLFKTLKARVRFTVLVTAIAVAAVAAYGIWGMNAAFRLDADRANERTLLAASHEVEQLLQNTTKVLGWIDYEAGSRSLDRESCLEAVNASLVGNQYPATFGVANSDGAVICAVGDYSEAAVASAVKRAATIGGIAVGKADKSGGQAEISLALGGNGLKGRGTVPFASLPIDAVSARLYAFDNYVVGVADSRGDLMTGLSGSAKIDTPPVPELVVEMLSRKSGTTQLKLNGNRYTFSFRRSDALEGSLYYYLGAPSYVVTAAADRATWQFLAVTSSLFALTLWLMSVLGGLVITRRIKRIMAGARQVISGELEPEQLPGGANELAGVTGLFSQLMLRLNAANASMEQQVKSRTSMLSLSKGITELQKARTEALLTSIGEGVVATDNRGRISFLNNQAKKALFWKATKTDGVPIYDAFHLESAKEELVPKDDWPVWPAINSGETVITSAPARPFYLRRKDGSRFPVKMIISPILLNNEVVGSLVVFGDITGEVEFDQRKSEFISVASHQLRSPSSAVKFMADMMRKGDLGTLTEKQLDWVEKLYLASDAMLNMVNELLNISRVEAGVKMDPQEHDLVNFLDEILKLSEPALLEKKQKFEVILDKTRVPKLIFDRFSIGEVLKNLISNASKYSPDGETVTVKIEFSDKIAFFSVRDRGMGIPKSSHDQMFNKFFRAENAMSSTITGTGLGLYYCKSVVEKHGGKIGFESEEGKGSVFYFTLPVGTSPLLDGEKCDSG